MGEASGRTVRSEAIGRRGRGWALGALAVGGIALMMVAGPALAATVGVAAASRPPVPVHDLGSARSLQDSGLRTGPTEIIGGTGTSGYVWRLSVNGPNQNLCFDVQVNDRASRGACATETVPVARQGPERRYRPMAFGEERTPVFLHGRLPEGTERVAVVAASGHVLAEQGTVEGPTGPFYVIEVPRGERVTTVVGSRRDGTSANYAVDLPLEGRAGRRGWAWAALATVLVATGVVRSLRARRRRDAGPPVPVA